VTFYKYITGTLPFEGKVKDGTYIKNVKSKEIQMKPLPDQVPEPLRSVVIRMLSKNPSE